MRKIVERVAGHGREAVQDLAVLLAEPVAANWLAFRLMEIVDGLDPTLEARCLEIIQAIASNPESIHAFGARAWLKQNDRASASRSA